MTLCVIDQRQCQCQPEDGTPCHAGTPALVQAALNAHAMALQSEIERLRELADSEGTRAVNYLRRARKAEKLLREVLESLPGLQAPNCLGMDLYQRIGEALRPNVRGKAAAEGSRALGE